MSADNWAKCPQCADQAAQHKGLRRALAAHYLPETLREDYEWWIDERDGVIHGHYQCTCNVCGFSKQVNVTQATQTPSPGILSITTFAA